jgi:branched-chain amino acid transport system permease protein
MEKSDARSLYRLAGFLVFIYAMPFAVGVMSGNVIYDMQWLADLTTVVLSGVMQGGVYAMFAVGLTLIFGVMRVINVAHGEFVVLGAYLTYVVFNSPQFLGYGDTIDPLLAMFITLPVAFCLGYLVQKVLLNAVVGGPELTPLLITFGLGISMINIIEWIFSTDYRTIPYFPDAFQITENIRLGKNKVVSFFIAFFITFGVFFFLKFHRFGKAIRATAQNADVAMVCGIDIYRVYLFTFGLATALAVAGGTLVSIQFGFNPETGLTYTVVAFAIIVLGGRGHYIGAFIGALMLGVLENLVSFMVPNGTALVEMAAYGLMILVLLIRPRGLLGPKID